MFEPSYDVDSDKIQCKNFLFVLQTVHPHQIKKFAHWPVFNGHCEQKGTQRIFNFNCERKTLNFFSFIRYHGSSSSIKCHVYHHVGGRRHTPVVCNEKRGPHTSHYTSNKKKQPTDYSNQPLCSRPVEIFLKLLWYKGNTEAKRCFATHDEDID